MYRTSDPLPPGLPDFDVVHASIYIVCITVYIHVHIHTHTYTCIYIHTCRDAFMSIEVSIQIRNMCIRVHII